MHFKSSGRLASVSDSVGGGTWGRKSRGWSGRRASGFLGELSLGEEPGATGAGDVEGVSANSTGPARDAASHSKSRFPNSATAFYYGTNGFTYANTLIPNTSASSSLLHLITLLLDIVSVCVPLCEKS